MLKIIKSINSSMFLVLLCSTLVIQGCSTPVQTTQESQPVPVKEQLEIPPQIGSAAVELLEQAQSASTENAITLLLQASERFLDQNQSDEALYICSELALMTLSPQQQRLNYLNSSQALFQLEQYNLAQAQLLKVTPLGNSSREHLLRAELSIEQKLPVQAIISYLNYYQQNTISTQEQVSELSLLFSQLTPYQTAALKKSKAPGISPWLKFDEIVNQYAAKPISLDFQLKKWRSEYPLHPLNQQIEDLTNVVNALNKQDKFSRIAVIIPLSGREQKLGKTLQSGILAANSFNPAQQLYFYDSNQLTMPAIIEQLQEFQPDAVIGPLLKGHVNDYLELTSSNSDASQDNADRIESSWTSLLLNMPENKTLNAKQFALSMLPEDEAKQAAFSLSKRGYKKALVLSQNTAIGKRMASSFADQWQLHTGVTPSVIYYPNGKQMQQSVKSGLDVNFSDQRVAAMKSKMKESIETETRNRRDIDVIYIFSTSNQAKLLKPYIDVNISPFANNIPIYASSRSNNDSNNSNTRRDLTGLTFTEIPWLLSGKQANPSLSKEAKAIWPTRSNSLERIYAMGIDSLQLINKVHALNQLPMLKHKGEIGTLQMDHEHIISRSLNWGRYRSSRVQSVEMD